MLIAGTAYDLYLQKQRKHRKNKNAFPKNFDIANPIQVKLDMPDGKANGKLNGRAIYVVNNNVEIIEENSAETSSVESSDDDGLSMNRFYN